MITIMGNSIIDTGCLFEVLACLKLVYFVLDKPLPGMDAVDLTPFLLTVAVIPLLPALRLTPDLLMLIFKPGAIFMLFLKRIAII